MARRRESARCWWYPRMKVAWRVRSAWPGSPAVASKQSNRSVSCWRSALAVPGRVRFSFFSHAWASCWPWIRAMRGLAIAPPKYRSVNDVFTCRGVFACVAAWSAFFFAWPDSVERCWICSSTAKIRPARYAGSWLSGSRPAMGTSVCCVGVLVKIRRSSAARGASTCRSARIRVTRCASADDGSGARSRAARSSCRPVSGGRPGFRAPRSAYRPPGPSRSGIHRPALRTSSHNG